MATLLQTVNFDKFGLKPDDYVHNAIVGPFLYGSSQAAIPRIALTSLEGGRRISSPVTQSKQGILCVLLPPQQVLPSRHELRDFLERQSRLDNVVSVFLPTDRGQMAFLHLNDNLQLTLRTQMQWHRNTAWHSYEDIQRRCLLMLTIVELDLTATLSAREEN